MRSRLQQIVAILLGVIIVLPAIVIAGALAYGVYVLIHRASAPLIAAAGTIVASVIAITLGNYFASRLKIDEANRSKKIPVYEDLLNFMFKLFDAPRTGKTIVENEVAEFVLAFNQRLMVWGGDIVVAAFVKWRRYITNADAVKARPHEGIFLYEDLILAIRRDLGHRNKGLATGDILAIFVNDVDSNLPRRT